MTEPTQRPARLTVGVVGAGRVGSVLGAALRRAGHRVVAVSAVSQESLTRAARRLPGVPVEPVPEVVAGADLVLLTLPDDALRRVVDGLTGTGAWRPGQLVAHTSGAYGLDVLAGANVLPLALHPVMTFTGRDEDEARIAGVHWGVTAPDELRPVAEALVVEMGGEPVWVPDADRPAFHAALTTASSHLITLVAEARELLAATGVPYPDLLLAPLAGASLDHALRAGDAAQNGPAARGDAATVALDVAAVRSRAPDALPGYLALARRTADRAIAAGRLTAEEAETLLAALAGSM